MSDKKQAVHKCTASRRSSAHTRKARRCDMRTLARSVSISILLTGAFGCSAGSSEKVAAGARVKVGSENTGAFKAPPARLVNRVIGVQAFGAVISAMAGGGKGAGIGALAGGGGGTGVVLATNGKEIHFGPETRLNVTLANSVQM